MEAQHFPEDFDGIIAGAPAFSVREGGLSNNWDSHQLFTRKGEAVFTEENLSLINRAVLKKCDALDGVTDGILEDPRDCDFDVATLACPNKKESPDCLTARQVESVKRLYDGPRNSQGTRLYPGYVTKGGELYWDRTPGGVYSIANNYLKYFAFEEKPPLSYTLWDFNFDTDLAKLESRAQKYEPVPPFTDPDLTDFGKTGGKLLVYHGWSDAWVSPLPSIDYYAEVVQNSNGVKNIRDWYRLFMMPGMKHCRGGDGPDSVNWLETMVRWVEQGEAPDQLLATEYENEPRHDWTKRGKTLRTRPVFPYPARAQYTGKGDVNDAKNWQAVPPGIKHEDDIKWIWDTE
jgi:feruloyl esterase